MPRTLSWLDRIVPISRSVAGSARSHYDRKELQKLFELQPRSAQQLMAAMPNVLVGRARLVQQGALAAFLDRLITSDDPARDYAALRQAGGVVVRRKLRGLTLQNVAANLDAPPSNMRLEPGELTVQFQDLEELAETMQYIAVALRDHLDEFARRFEPPQPKVLDEPIQPMQAAEAEYFRIWKPGDA